MATHVHSEEGVSRRSVLRGVAAGVAATGLAGEAFAAQNDRVIVGFEPGADVSTAEAQATSVHRRLDFGDIGKAVAGQFPEQAIQGLQNNPNVRYIEEDGRAFALQQELPWGVDRVDADLVHDAGETGGDGQGADIAIIDTGIDSDHPDLQANLGAGQAFVNCSGGNGNTCFEPWDDDNDHGTHCAGIADAVDNNQDVVGVSTEATLHAVKVLDANGGGSFSDIAAGIEFVANQGWDVASMSLGAPQGSSAIQDAVEFASNNGVVLVAAAGNSGPCSNCVGFPAAYEQVIAVSSIDQNDNLSGFSSTGPEVELAAPGSNVPSTVPGGTATFSGTSMACPHVAGAAGQLIDNGLSASQVRSRLQNTAEDIGLGSNEQGFGLLDVDAAVQDDGGGEPGLSVTTGNATNVGADNATLNGSLNDLGGAASADVFFEFRQAGSTSFNQTPAQTLSAAGSFSADVTGLATNTDYEFRAVANASDGDSDTGALATFTTGGGGGGSAPSIDTFNVSGSCFFGCNIDVELAVSDADGDLAAIEVLLIGASGNVLDSFSTGLSGSSASGTVTLTSSFGEDPDVVEVTVTDEAGNTTTDRVD